MIVQSKDVSPRILHQAQIHALPLDGVTCAFERVSGFLEVRDVELERAPPVAKRAWDGLLPREQGDGAALGRHDGPDRVDLPRYAKPERVPVESQRPPHIPHLQEQVTNVLYERHGPWHDDRAHI